MYIKKKTTNVTSVLLSNYPFSQRIPDDTGHPKHRDWPVPERNRRNRRAQSARGPIILSLLFLSHGFPQLSFQDSTAGGAVGIS